MATLAEIREQYPQYEDMSDRQLADALHSTFYSDMDRGEFERRHRLRVANRIQPMPKVSFNPQALSQPATDNHSGDTVHSLCNCAFIPVMPTALGVEAVFEGLRLAGIKGFVPDLIIDDNPPAQEVNPRNLKEGR